MQYHDLEQGTPEWDAFRLEHFGASEAAAMLGLSTKTSRNELLNAKASGNPKVFSQYVQEKILDYGHEVEAKARPIIIQRIGKKLYPVTVSDGKLSASCDGLTMDETEAFEHKQWNATLAAHIVETGQPTEEHMPQCQQILMITGAKVVHFVVSDGTEANMVVAQVYPDDAWFERIRAGWAQFANDLDHYVHVVDAPKPEGKAPEQLPALHIELVGKVSASNLDAFHGHALAVLGAINRNLQTDEDFASAEKTVKWCGDVETRLDAAKQHALSQTADIDKLFRTIDAIKEETRKTRLELDRLVKARKESLRAEMTQKANAEYADMVAALQEGIKAVRLSGLLAVPDFAGAIKGKREISSMRNALDTLLANSTIAANAMAKSVTAKIAWCKENAEGYGGLFHDMQHLVSYDMDAFKVIVRNRIDEHNKAEEERIEADRARIRAEEQAKAEREARAKLEAEQRAASAKNGTSEDAAGPSSPVASTPAASEVPTSKQPLRASPGSMRASTKKTAPDRPTDDEIVLCIANYFGTTIESAKSWILDVA